MSMSSVEQYLTMVNREVIAMCRDPLGSLTRISFADRVIADVTDISGFASSVMASTNPLAVILAVYRSAITRNRDQVLVRFFDEQLHEARLELVEVLVEASGSTGRSQIERENHRYLRKLYEKSVKKFVKIIGAPKTKHQEIDDKFPSLGALSGYGRYRNSYLDIEDDDDDDGYEGSYTDYADEYIQALREGRQPPRPRTYAKEEPFFDFGDGQSDIMRLIGNIQEKLGRNLSSAEIINIIREATKGEESEAPAMPETPNMPDWSSFVDAVANAVIQKMSAEAETLEEQIPLKNDLDEFIEKNREMPVSEESKPTRAAVTERAPSGTSVVIESEVTASFKGEPKPPVVRREPDPVAMPREEITTEQLIQKLNGVSPTTRPQPTMHIYRAPSEEAEREAVLGSIPEKPSESASEEESTETESQPPIEEMGGVVDDVVEAEESCEDLDEEENTEPPANGIFKEFRESPYYLENIRNFVNAPYGQDVFKDNIFLVLPSMYPEYLFDVRVITVIDEDPEAYNVLYLNAINSRECQALAAALEIDPELINLSSELVHIGDPLSGLGENLAKNDSSTFSELVGTNPHLVKHGWDLNRIYWHLDSLCDVALEIYKASTILPKVLSFVDIEANRTDLYIGLKEAWDLKAKNYDSDSLGAFYIAANNASKNHTWATEKIELKTDEVTVSLLDSRDADLGPETRFMGKLETYLDGNSATDYAICELMNAVNKLRVAVHCVDDTLEYDKILVNVKTSSSTTPNGVCWDIMYNVETPAGALTLDNTRDVERDFENSFAAKTAIELLLMVISPSYHVDIFTRFEESHSEVEEIQEETTESYRTDAFGA